MNIHLVIKALANPTRVAILNGLKNPAAHFPPQDEGDIAVDGVCVSSIQEGIGLSQSTTSSYLELLQRAGLVKVTRRGRWTYYKRDEDGISQFAEAVKQQL
ncbi:helix-turn-helix transcriptional regulator [Thalassospira sp. MCCC 1A01428]|uniref:ArsR/SmtB family transcription factor n=1 Tax=Thalassospira sp. MCCC 1A01428 TaxID=1470575 RepID=UPI000A1F031A|nr:metalloregulator ArsR/SmtB family transcription factor [Thalassospira sp. MCCC 1A01428]OSQ42022.1 ArsR family transcriptional regulator [Thalassospira sp. MCCC 1A01428]